jgi:serpin B
MKQMTCLAVLFVMSIEAPGQPTESAKPANAFAFEQFHLFRAMTEGNFCFSPYSVHKVASVAAEAAREDTLAELLRLTHLPAKAEDRAAIESELSASLRETSANTNLSLEVANALWTAPRTPVLQNFSELVKARFGTTVFALNDGDPVKASATINQWIRQKTRGRIPQIVGPSSFPDTDATATFVNAIYLKALWSEPFSPLKTRPRPFYLKSSQPVDLPQMTQKNFFEYAEADTWQCVRLKMASGELRMTILLPRQESGREALESGLSSATWEKLSSMMAAWDVNLALPRFSFSTELNFKPLWQALGAKLVFDRDNADLGNAFQESRTGLSGVFHHATIEVNEIGAEAAAATASPADPFGGAEQNKKRVATFIANHPFIWMIEHHETGLILFMGRFAGE